MSEKAENECREVLKPQTCSWSDPPLHPGLWRSGGTSEPVRLMKNDKLFKWFSLSFYINVILESPVRPLQAGSEVRVCYRTAPLKLGTLELGGGVNLRLCTAAADEGAGSVTVPWYFFFQTAPHFGSQTFVDVLIPSPLQPCNCPLGV